MLQKQCQTWNQKSNKKIIETNEKGNTQKLTGYIEKQF